MAHGQGGAEIASERSPTLTCNHEAPIAAYSTKLHNTASNQAGKVYEEYATSLDANSPPPAVFAPVTQFGETAGTLTACHDSSPRADRGMNVVAQPIAFHPTQDPISSSDVCHAIGTANGQGCATAAVAFQERGRADGRSLEIGGDVAYALTAPRGGGRAQERNVLTPTMAVRRLTPVECERLQGFPDGYTAIPWRKKPASECPDGPRYNALGNSWAVPVVAWIGERIQAAL
jgi:DNA (cytosine-5)-methyltransferase 1